MITCPHCGAENSSKVIFCIRCQTNVYYKGPSVEESEPAATPEEIRLREKIENAQATIGICGFFLAAPIFFVLIRFIGLQEDPEGGFIMIEMIVGIVKWGALLVIPFVGILLAQRSKRAAMAKLEILRSLRHTANNKGNSS